MDENGVRSKIQFDDIKKRYRMLRNKLLRWSMNFREKVTVPACE